MNEGDYNVTCTPTLVCLDQLMTTEIDNTGGLHIPNMVIIYTSLCQIHEYNMLE